MQHDVKNFDQSFPVLRLFNAKMWVTLVVACVITGLAISDSRALYYKVRTGQIFGPFAEEQVISWYRDGYFQGDQVHVSEHPSDIFSPVEEFIQTFSRKTFTKPKSKGLIAKLGKKAGAAYKVQRTKLKNLANSITSIYPTPQTKENVEKQSKSSPEGSSWSESIDTNLVQPQEKLNLVFEPESQPNELSTKASNELEPINATDSNSSLDTSEGSEKELLAQLKRDDDDASTRQQEVSSNPFENPPPFRHIGHRKEDRETIKYSVKSLPKGDYTLWDAEDVKSKSSAMDKLLEDFETPPPPAITENNNEASTSAVKRGTIRQVFKQLRAVVLEILRFVVGLLMRLLPGPMQQSAMLIGVLLTITENHAVLISLLALGIFALLRDVLYLMLFPSVCALVLAVAPVMQSGIKATAIDVATFSSAQAGDIVTTVFQNIAADSSSVHEMNAAHASAMGTSFASARAFFQELIKSVRNLNQDNAHDVILASFEKLKSVGNVKDSDVTNTLIQAKTILASLLHQLALMEKEAVVVVLIVSALFIVHTVLLPLVEATLTQSEVLLLPESDDTFSGDDGVDDELLPSNTRDSGVSRAGGDQINSATTGVARGVRVSAVALTNHVRSVFALVFQLIVCGSLLLVLYCSVQSTLPLHSSRPIVAPLLLSLVLSVLKLYAHRPGILTGSRDSVPAFDNVENWQDTISSVDRLNYLSDLVGNEHQLAECKRWGLDTYVLSLLAHEQKQLSANYVKTDQARAEQMPRQNSYTHVQIFSLFTAVEVLIISVVSWLLLREDHIWSVLHSHPMNIAQAAENILRASRSGEVSTSLGVRMTDVLLLRPLECLQHIATNLLAWGGAVGDSHSATHPSTLFTLSNAGSTHRVMIANVFNTAMIIAVVLLLPSLLQILQSATLSAVRTHSAVLSRDFAPPSVANSASDAHQAHITKSLWRSQRVLSLAQNDQQEVAKEWNTQGLDVSAGIALQHVTATLNGRMVLNDVSLRLPAGSITVLVSPTHRDGDVDAASALLSLLWQSVSPGRKHKGGPLQQLCGTVSVQGRELSEWDKEVLRGQFAYLSAKEEPLRIHAGALAGCLPGTSGELLRHALRAQAASGAYQIITALPAGPATVVWSQVQRGDRSGESASERQNNRASGEVELSPDQIAALHLSRALCHSDKPFVLLTGPTDGMSEDQERLFFDYLRSQMRPDQVIVLTTARQHTAEMYGDYVIVLDATGGCAEVTTPKAEDKLTTAQG